MQNHTMYLLSILFHEQESYYLHLDIRQCFLSHHLHLEQPRYKYPHLFLYNDEFLYAGRKLVNHQGGTAEEFCNQLRKQNETVGFVNYFSNQNGFTLADVFSYNEKHNEENGEENTDGMAFNFSQNCGIEGRTNRAYVRALRKKRMYLQWRTQMWHQWKIWNVKQKPVIRKVDQRI